MLRLMASDRYSEAVDLKVEVIITFPGLTKSSVVHVQTEDVVIFSVSVFKFVNNKSGS